MKVFGTVALGVLVVFLAYALMMFGISFAGFFGGAETFMVIAAVLSLVMWGTFIGLTIYALILAIALIRGQGSRLSRSLAWTRSLLLTMALMSIVSAFPLALGAFSSCGPLWLSNIYHWGGIIGSFFGFIAYFGMAYVVRACVGSQGKYSQPHHWRWPVITGSVVYGFWGLVWLIAWLVLSGSIDTSNYPNRTTSLYKLPYPSGESSWIIQGNNSSLNHSGSDEEHAWDFRRRCGTSVLAARDGCVRAVTDSHSGNGSSKPNNVVEVLHTDNSVAYYMHIQRRSAVLRPSTTNTCPGVNQGEELAKVGNVGNSLTGHIHFVVRDASNNSIPVSFKDVRDDKGIPRGFNSYKSGN